MKELGAIFEKAAAQFEVSECVSPPNVGVLTSTKAKVVVDGNLITGQNPASGKGVGEELDKMLSA